MMRHMRIASDRLISETEIKASDGMSVEMHLIDALRALFEEARRHGPVTLADVRSLRLRIDDYAFSFGSDTLRVGFRMDKEVDG